MIEPVYRFYDFSKPAKKGGLAEGASESVPGIPEPALSREERNRLESIFIFRPASSGSLPLKEMLHNRLTLVADNLNDVAELTQLLPLAEAIQQARRRKMNSEPKRGFLPSLYVLGGGAQCTDAFPYRSPEAEEIRDRLHRLAAVFFERPAEAKTEDDLRRHMQQLLDRP